MPSQATASKSCVRVVRAVVELWSKLLEITVVLPVTFSYPFVSFLHFIFDGNHEKKRIAAAGTLPDSNYSLSFTANAREKQQAALGQPKLDP